MRDFYLRELFGADPVGLRSQDLPRYLALSRVVTGEVMRRTYAEWRSGGSSCRGALTWLWRDVRPGAGWGVVDVGGRPKPAYWSLKRAWAPVAVHLTDEGLDGYGIHVVNDRPEALHARLRFELFRHGKRVEAARPVDADIPARATRSFPADALLGYFTDATNAYRFGPAKYDVVAAILEDAQGQVISEDFAFPLGWTLERAPGALCASAHRVDDERIELTLAAGCLLQAVRIDAEGWEPGDNFFHLRPDEPRRIVLRAIAPGAIPPQVCVSALNSAAEVVAVPEASKLSRKVNA